jgi:hypothetical protein
MPEAVDSAAPRFGIHLRPTLSSSPFLASGIAQWRRPAPRESAGEAATLRAPARPRTPLAMSDFDLDQAQSQTKLCRIARIFGRRPICRREAWIACRRHRSLHLVLAQYRRRSSFGPVGSQPLGVASWPKAAQLALETGMPEEESAAKGGTVGP